MALKDILGQIKKSITKSFLSGADMKKGLLLIMASGFIALSQAMEGGAYSVLGGTPRTFMNDIKNYLHIVLTLNDGTEVKGDLQGTPDNAVRTKQVNITCANRKKCAKNYGN